MKLSIIIVSWNVKDKLRSNLEALFKSVTDFDFEVFVVDNDSKDGTTAIISKEFPQAILIENRENLGFAKANNQAIKSARGEFVLLLNPDMRVEPYTLRNMVSWFELHPQAMVASCKLTDEQGKILHHVRRFPTLKDQLAIVLKLPHIFPALLSNYLADDFNYELQGKVDSVRGSFFLMRRPTNDLPLLDERYFIWFEEVDYCMQVRKTGMEVWYTPTAVCVDYVGASFSQVKKGKTQDYFEDSMLKYFKKWHPHWQYMILKIVWPFGKFLAVAAEKIRLKSDKKT